MLKLDKWQQEVLDYEGDLLLCTGRRVGKTYILSRKAIDLMAKKPGLPIVIVSLTEDQALIIMSMALNYAKENYKWLIGKGKFKPCMKSMYINGGRMIVRPVGNTGDAARGFEGGVLIVDEAARMPKQFWLAAKPILLTTNGKIWMSSTPFGKKGYFWEKYDEVINKKIEAPRFKVFSISTEEVMANRPVCASWTEEQKQGALRILEQDKKEMTWSEYSQEYLGKFIDELLNFFPEELIEKCCILKRLSIIESKYKHYLGVDIARMGEDEGTYEIIKKISNEKFMQVENIITKKQLTTETERKIIELNNKYDFSQIGLDAGAGTLGVSILDHLLNENSTKRKIIALNNRAIAIDNEGKRKQKLFKEDLYNNLKAMMENRQIEFLDDDEIKLSLRSIQIDIEEKEEGISKTRIFSKYGHIVEGIIRAAWIASKDKTLNIWCG